MNLKGMKISFHYHLILILLPALTHVFFMTPISGELTYREGLFRKITTSKCLIDQKKMTEYTSSPKECAFRCISRDECEYFSYCNGPCYMHRSTYLKEIRDYNCSCSSYILLSENGTRWQKVFRMAENSFERSPIYLYWDELPIEKVEFWLRRTNDLPYIFNGTGSNSTSWYHEDNIIVNPYLGHNPQIFTFNNNFSNPYFKIDAGVPPSNLLFEARRKSGNESYAISVTKPNGGSEWIKIYAISMKADSFVYNSFLNIGSPSTWNVDKCNGIYCPNFFRHPLLDFWNRLPIEQVKLVIYKKQTAVVTMVFDGRNTTIENWFSPNNLKSSPWKDLEPGRTNYFSLAGFRSQRRFYVSNYHDVCSKDRGWLFITEPPVPCSWAKSDYNPTIFYSKTDMKTTWNNGYGKADSMAIFIQLREN